MTAQDQAPSFEDALKELETIVDKLERGEVSLDDAVAAYERGSELKKQCQARLDEARLKVDKIRATPASSKIDKTVPFDAE
jgi:exodeoxyribonuclease VII small subunit